MNKTIKIEYPQSLAQSMRLGDKDFQDEMKTSSIVKLFELGRISSGTAAKVLGLTRVDFLDILPKYNVSALGQFGLDDLSEDIANA